MTATTKPDPRLKAIWSATHRDFRGLVNGEKTILIWRNGTNLVPLRLLTESEIADKYKSAESILARRKADKAAKAAAKESTI